MLIHAGQAIDRVVLAWLGRWGWSAQQHQQRGQAAHGALPGLCAALPEHRKHRQRHSRRQRRPNQIRSAPARLIYLAQTLAGCIHVIRQSAIVHIFGHEQVSSTCRESALVHLADAPGCTRRGRRARQQQPLQHIPVALCEPPALQRGAGCRSTCRQGGCWRRGNAGAALAAGGQAWRCSWRPHAAGVSHAL
jgi:hypothetical protein